MEKIELGKQYETRSGLEVVPLDLDMGGPYPVLAKIRNKDGLWSSHRYTGKGESMQDRISNLDILPARKSFRHKRWIPVWREGAQAGYPSQEEARRVLGSSVIALVPVTLEGKEGDGLCL